NFKYVVIASIVVIGQGVVWYSGQFWALYFLQQVSKVDVVTSSYIVGIALLIATPTLILFGWLSDLIGRKPVLLGGMLLASLIYSIAVPAVCFVLALFLMPETRKISIWEPTKGRSAA